MVRIEFANYKVVNFVEIGTSWLFTQSFSTLNQMMAESCRSNLVGGNIRTLK